MLIETLSTGLDLVFPTDVTNTSYTTLTPTGTEPVASATRGVIEWLPSGKRRGLSENMIFLLPIGRGANDAVVTGMRVVGWRRVSGRNSSSPLTDLWVPVPLFECDMVYGNITGVAGSVLGTTYFFMDTINPGAYGTAGLDYSVVSPGNDMVASIVVDAKGFQKIEINVDLGANATHFNCLYGRY